MVAHTWHKVPECRRALGVIVAPCFGAVQVAKPGLGMSDSVNWGEGLSTASLPTWSCQVQVQQVILQAGGCPGTWVCSLTLQRRTLGPTFEQIATPPPAPPHGRPGPAPNAKSWAGGRAHEGGAKACSGDSLAALLYELGQGCASRKRGGHGRAHGGAHHLLA